MSFYFRMCPKDFLRMEVFIGCRHNVKHYTDPYLVKLTLGCRTSQEYKTNRDKYTFDSRIDYVR
jgi:hypothetical protein